MINVGTLTQPRAQAMRAAVEQAKSSQTPWTLDPVAVGALDYRRHFCHELLSFKPAAIRGNASEIMALAGIANGGREWIPLTPQLTRYPLHKHWHGKLAQSVVVTGEMDYVTDGHRIIGIHGGDPLMTKVVGTGCALSAVVAACCALPGDTLENVASACHWMKQAGERAVARSEGPGSFVPHFLDALWQLTQEVQA
ncbi:hydroxyethylthiazole kinase [Escherichia coli]|uniref:hydroxyethylthiazole kinase n=1 Tax=Escherichia coli TaxID=562 RepID=A0A2X1MXK9_ECOLX|nr:hydroxyethylthiazole kinase [Escherichia coli]